MQEPVPAGRFAAGTASSSTADQPIRRAATAVTAFVGRALKGPVDEPVRITSFLQYQQSFGGLWQPSPLSYAVEQYFENGGEEAVIVRVASGGHPPTLDLPAGDEVLCLQGRYPGSRECLRASVDYDGIDPQEPSLFNLVVQRVRAPGSELVEAQEIYRRLSVVAGSPRCVATVLSGSRLLRVLGEVPSQRPDPTPGEPGRSLVGYVRCNANGHDGSELSDYDLIGNQVLRRGLFALEEGPAFNFLCVPPLTRERDVGMSTLLVAARLCRRLNALLIVDPPRSWRTSAAALEGLERWPFQSSDALMFFPRIEAMDRLRNRPERFAPCGAAAGRMARADRSGPHWWSTDPANLPLASNQSPSTPVTDSQAMLLAQSGVHLIGDARAVSDTRLTARQPDGGHRRGDLRSINARRLLLWVLASIERGTRWTLLQRNSPVARERARAQVMNFLGECVRDGAFAEQGFGDEFFVICDERLNTQPVVRAGEFRLLYGVASGPGKEFEGWLVTHRPDGSQSRPASVNRLVTADRTLDLQIESAIRRGMSR